jgi:hypothetical protein
MSVVKHRRLLRLSDSEMRRLAISGACVCAPLALDACTLTTSLDFVGNSPSTKTTKPNGGGASSGGVGGNAGTTTDAVPSAGAGGQTPASGGSAGSAGDAGASGAAGATTPNPVCDDTCAAQGICSGDSCQCPSGMPACNNGCREAIEQAGFCGSCGKACGDDQRCVGGVCQCLEAGKASCSSGCVSLDTDLEHCGKCENACSQGQLCIAGACRSSPCDGFCANAEPMPRASDGFRSGNVGTNERCYAVSDYTPTQTQARIVCWQFEAARSLKVNGVSTPCIRDNGGTALNRQTEGWYCVQIGAGDWGDGAVLLPNF